MLDGRMPSRGLRRPAVVKRDRVSAVRAAPDPSLAGGTSVPGWALGKPKNQHAGDGPSQSPKHQGCFLEGGCQAGAGQALLSHGTF